MSVEILTKGDLQAFKQELVDEIKTTINKETTEKKWLRSTEVRKLLNISPGTLQNLRVNGTLPFTKIGGVLYYEYSDILQVFEDNKIDNSIM